jgi:hypothetical protein
MKFREFQDIIIKISEKTIRNSSGSPGRFIRQFFISYADELRRAMG